MNDLLDKPRVGYVIALMIAGASGIGYLKASIASLEKDSEGRDKFAAFAIQQRNIEIAEVKARLSAIEARNCPRGP